MEIDWFTVGAQVVNFLVLVALLKKFLYGPIVRVMDERQARVAHRLEEAEAREERAKKEAEALRDKQEAIERERDDRLAELEREVAEERRRMLAEAREDVSQARDEWFGALERDQDQLLHEFRLQAEHRLFVALRRILGDVADAELDRRVVEIFVRRFRSLPDTELRALAPSAEDGSAAVHVHTAFEHPAKQQDRIEAALREAFGDHISVEFDVDADLLAGIELRTDGRKFGWSLQDYLQGLEEELIEELQQPSSATTEPVSAAEDRRVG